jgi:hypothetical protein
MSTPASLLSLNGTRSWSDATSAFGARAPIVVWLPYVGLTTFLLALVCVSFLHFHRHNGHKYRRQPESPSVSQLELMTTSRLPPLVHSSTAEVFARFNMTSPSAGAVAASWGDAKAGSGNWGRGGGGGNATRSAARQTLTFAVNANGSMVDIRSASTSRAEKTASTAPVATSSSSARHYLTSDYNCEAVDAKFECNCNGGRSTVGNNNCLYSNSNCSNRSPLRQNAAATRSSNISSSNRVYPASTNNHVSQQNWRQNDDTDLDPDPIRIILHNTKNDSISGSYNNNNNRVPLRRRNTDEGIKSLPTGYLMSRDRDLNKERKNCQQATSSFDIAALAVSDRRVGGARLLPQPPAD